MADKPIYHFYHIFADSAFDDAVNQHAQALVEYGLADNLAEFYVGLVGTVENQKRAMGLLYKHGLTPIAVASAAEGYEQITMQAIRDFVHKNKQEAAILYAHTKGSFNATPINIAWRASMCYYNVVKWENMVYALKFYDTAGCHWLERPVEDGRYYRFYGGTYWWANASYLRTLPELDYRDRWEAEPWIGDNPKVTHYDANPGWPAFELFTTSW